MSRSAHLAPQADVWYNNLIRTFDRSDTDNIPRSELYLFERQANGYSILTTSPLQAVRLRLSLFTAWRQAMSAPKDPEKYQEWKQKLSEAHKGKTHGAETRAKISELGKGRKMPAEAIAKTAAAHRGLKHTDETKAKMRAAKLGKPGNRKGKQLDEATKEKISATLKGRQMTPEQRVNYDAAMKKHLENLTPEQRYAHGSGNRGKHFTEEHRKKISAGTKGLIPPTKGKRYTEEEKARIYANVYGNTWSRGRRMPEHVRQMLWTPEMIAKRAESYRNGFAALTEEERIERLLPWMKAARSGKNSDTSIERFVASQFDAKGIAYEPQKRFGRYFVDFFIAEQNLIVEVMGCYWHSCEQCGYDDFPEKREYDRKRIAYLEAKGYTVELLWEHDLRPLMEDITRSG